MEKQDEKKLLTTLKSIDGTLKRIEQLLSAENQHNVIKEAVSHAMMGDKSNFVPDNYGKYINEAVRTAIHDISQ